MSTGSENAGGEEREQREAAAVAEAARAGDEAGAAHRDAGKGKAGDAEQSGETRKQIRGAGALTSNAKGEDDPSTGAETPALPEAAQKSERRGSLRLVIGVIYGLLALGNIIISSVLIFENQAALLQENVQLHADRVANAVFGELQQTELRSEDGAYDRLGRVFSGQDLERYLLFNADGEILRRFPEDPEAPAQVSEQLQQQIVEFTAEQSLFQSRFTKELNEDDYTIRLLFPLRGEGGEDLFLFAVLSLQQLSEMQQNIFIQAALNAGVIIVLHVVIAFFLFRLIFVRVDRLKDASLRMAGGELAARAEWKRSRKDELDDLGDAFNSMASSIQSNVETITLLNNQIQEELTIGKEVQELFLGNLKLLKDYKPHLYYRPLREVSGDVYKFYAFRGGYTGVFFADASGHGVSAALITTITILSLEEVLRKNINPSKVMTKLNELLAERLDTTFYATGVFLLFDPRGRTYVTNSGHNNVLFFSDRNEDGKEVQIKSHGPPLGLMDGVSYKANMINTKAGDRIFVHSDGLIETKNAAGEQYTQERLLRFLHTRLPADNTEIGEALKADFEAHARDYDDDVSSLMLEIP